MKPKDIMLWPAALFAVFLYLKYPTFNPFAYLVGAAIGYVILLMIGKGKQ